MRADAIDCVSAMERFPTLLELWVEISDIHPAKDAADSARGSTSDVDHDFEVRFFEQLACELKETIELFQKREREPEPDPEPDTLPQVTLFQLQVAYAWLMQRVGGQRLEDALLVWQTLVASLDVQVATTVPGSQPASETSELLGVALHALADCIRQVSGGLRAYL